MIVWLWTAAAWAQSPGQPGYVPPNLSAETYRPVVDARSTLATEHGRVTPGWHARSELVWLHRPLTFTEADSGEVIAILANAVGTNLSGAGGVGPVRIGVTAPAWLLTTGDVHDGSAMVLGDPTLDLKVALPTGEAVGAALVARAGTSLGAQERQLGRGGPWWEAGAAADVAVDRFGAALNVGLRGVPTTTLGELPVDDVGWVRGAASWAVTDETSLSLEGLGQVPLRDPDPSQVPVELLAGVHHRAEAGWGVHGGVGRGVTAGVGAPGARLVLGLSWHGPSPSHAGNRPPQPNP